MTPAKTADYYDTDRTEFLDWVGGHHARVLDVGCGNGASAAWYRRHGATESVGVEVHEESVANAAAVMDRVVALPIEAALGDLHEPFDLIVCADVLEHLTDPWSVVAGLRGLAHERTVLAVSIPNIRFLPAVARIAFGRGFAYEESGIFDSTHLRFFTRPDVDRMLRDGGWRPQKWGAPSDGRFATPRRIAARVSGGRSSEWFASQMYVTAKLTVANG